MARGKQWSIEDRKSAVKVWFSTGSLYESAKQTGIPRRTMQDWVNTVWWVEETDRLILEYRRKFLGKSTGMLDTILDVIKDRMEKGDEVVTKNGELVRRGISARDATWVLGVLFDKKNILMGEPTSISVRKPMKEQLDDAKRALHEYGEELFSETDNKDLH